MTLCAHVLPRSQHDAANLTCTNGVTITTATSASISVKRICETIDPLEGRLADVDRQRLRDAMGAEAFDAEYAAGGTLDSAEVLAALGRKEATADQAREGVTGEAMTVLTPRELDVLKLVAQGLGNADIARRLVLSKHTVHRHLANILRKLGLSSRAAAAAWGARAGLV